MANVLLAGKTTPRVCSGTILTELRSTGSAQLTSGRALSSSARRRSQGRSRKETFVQDMLSNCGSVRDVVDAKISARSGSFRRTWSM